MQMFARNFFDFFREGANFQCSRYDCRGSSGCVRAGMRILFRRNTVRGSARAGNTALDKCFLSKYLS